jgi:serine/threonine protein kinase
VRERHGSFSHVEGTFVRYMHEISQGLQHLHGKGIVHGDVKPSNCLLVQVAAAPSASNLSCKLGDFGLAVQASRLGGVAALLPELGQGTPGFMAPELMSAERRHDVVVSLSAKCDVWAFGTTLWCLVELRQPFEGGDVNIFWIRDFLKSGKRLEMGSSCPAVLQSVIKSCWAANPDSRPDMSSIVAWLSDRAEECCHPRTDSDNNSCAVDASAMERYHPTLASNFTLIGSPILNLSQ